MFDQPNIIIDYNIDNLNAREHAREHAREQGQGPGQSREQTREEEQDEGKRQSHILKIAKTPSVSFDKNTPKNNSYENINNLLINTGVNYVIHKIMADFHSGNKTDKEDIGATPCVGIDVCAGTWPKSTSYCCWYCCHPFTETPVGIPEKIIIENNNICFELAGNFCSYNCAYSYINPQSADDLAGINISIDYVHSDDKSNKIQLLELLCSLECNTTFLKKIKPAPPRLALNTFGGPLDIIAFRDNFNLHTDFHIFKYPVVPITYSLGELKTSTKAQVSSVDYTGIEYICKLWENKCNNKSNSYSFK
jgi:hypothetical protein